MTRNEIIENNRNKKLGQEKPNYQNCIMKIIEYNNSKNIVIEFQDKYKEKIRTSYSNFNKGNIKNHFIPTVLNIGYLGCTKVNNANAYKHWVAILYRCYDKTSLKKSPNYIGCSVCDEWLCYKNFEEWYEKNYYEIPNEEMCLDKDILIKGNKIYSPNTCVFVPKRINTLFIKCDKARGNLPIGVSKREENKYKNSYRAKCRNIYGKRITSKTYKNPIECFYEYKKIKEQTIKDAADLYKDKIPNKLYDAMYNWKVEVND